MSFSIETEKKKRLFFLDIEIIRKQGKFTITVSCKHTFSGVYSTFESSLTSVHKFVMIYTLVYRRFHICSNWTQFHIELVLKDILREWLL